MRVKWALFACAALSCAIRAHPRAEPDDAFDLINQTETDVEKRYLYPLNPRLGSGVRVPLASFRRWTALGDSYAAGPGAGTPFSDSRGDRKPGGGRCYRNKGAYAPQLNRGDIFDGYRGLTGGRDIVFDFPACTGFTTTEITDSINALDFDSTRRIVTMSAGGNDVQFSRVVSNCFFGNLSCSSVVQRSQDLLHGAAFKQRFYAMMNALLGKISFCPPNDSDRCRTVVLETAYPQFFSESSKACDTRTFNVVRRGAFLTQDFRRTINQAIQELNILTSWWLDELNFLNRPNPNAVDPFTFVDQNSGYTGHRFCRNDGTGIPLTPRFGGRSDPSTWIFDFGSERDEFDAPGGSSGTVETNEFTTADYYSNVDVAACQSNPPLDLDASYGCAVAQLLAQGDMSPTEPALLPMFATKSIHPKVEGFGVTRQFLEAALTFQQPIPAFQRPTSQAACGSIRGLDLRILTIGDSITHGYQAATPDGQGYRDRLYELLTSPGNDGTCDTNVGEVTFVGTEGVAADGSQPNRCNNGYNGATVQEIRNAVINNEDEIFDYGANVILLMGGTNNWLQRAKPGPRTPETTAAALDSFIGELLDRTDAVIIVGHVILNGRAGVPDVFEPGTRNRGYLEYNARINRLVAERQEAGAPVYVAYTQVAPRPEEHGADEIHPNDLGYGRLADSWYEAIYLALQSRSIGTGDEGDFPAPQGDGQNGLQCDRAEGRDNGGGGVGAETPGNCPYGKIDVPPSGHFCPSKPYYVPNGIIASGGALGANLYGPVRCRSTPGDGRAICRCTKHDDAFNPNGGPSTDWDAAYADEIGGDCSAMDLDFTTAVRMADMDGDGDMDYLFVLADSSVLGFENLGTQGRGEANVFYKFHKRIAKGVPGHEHITYDFRHEIQFADLNGDGFADYIWTHPNGRVEAWLNAGNGWCNLDDNGFHYIGYIASGAGLPGGGVRHVDLNGDGRADYVYVAPDGTTHAFMNQPDPDPDVRESDGILYVDNGQIHGPAPSGVGRSGVQFADTSGKGYADYIAVSANGAAHLSYNGGPITNENDMHRYFQSHGQIAAGTNDGNQVLFADLDGDSRAEYMVVNNNNSAVFAFYSNCDADASRVSCRAAPGNAPSRQQADSTAQLFCSQHDGQKVGAHQRRELVGSAASLSAICSLCTDESPSYVFLKEDDCNKAFSHIFDECDSFAGTWQGDIVEYVSYRY